MDDNDDDNDDAVEFIPPFEVDPNIYEFIPSLACADYQSLFKGDTKTTNSHVYGVIICCYTPSLYTRMIQRRIHINPEDLSFYTTFKAPGDDFSVDVGDVLGTLAGMGGAIPPAEGFQRRTIPWLAPWLLAPWLPATAIEEAGRAIFYIVYVLFYVNEKNKNQDNGTTFSGAKEYGTKCGAKGILVPKRFVLTWRHFLAMAPRVPNKHGAK
ncbi:hypothetical protein Tco_1501839 [Tanacetum coccineum]